MRMCCNACGVPVKHEPTTTAKPKREAPSPDKPAPALVKAKPAAKPLPDLGWDPARAVKQAKADLRDVRRHIKALRKELAKAEKAERELSKLVGAAKPAPKQRGQARLAAIH